PALAANVLQEWPDETDDRHGEKNGDHRPCDPAHAVAFDRDEQVALDGVAQHDAEDERRARQFELLHHPADDAKQQKGKEIAPGARRLERADIDDAENRRKDESVAQGGELGELWTEGVTQTGTQDV